MTDTSNRSQRNTRLAGGIIALLVVLILGFVTIGVVNAAGAPKSGQVRAAQTSSSAAADPGSSSAPPAPPTSASARPSVTARPGTRATKPAQPVTAASPQPTHTAAITAPVTIVKAFTARVTKTEAVQGKAQGPGEIGGPSVRFTVSLHNTTGKRVDLANTVVNAYFGSAATPAVQLALPGGRNFPSSLSNGATVTGVYVFNIPRDQRAKVQVTVDTSVNNPVIAFKGSAPR